MCVVLFLAVLDGRSILQQYDPNSVLDVLKPFKAVLDS